MESVNDIILKSKLELLKKLEEHELFKEFEFGGMYEADYRTGEIKRFVYLRPSLDCWSSGWILFLTLTKTNLIRKNSEIEKMSLSSLKNLKYIGKYDIHKTKEYYRYEFDGKIKGSIDM